MSFFPEKSTVERIKKLENSVRILQRQIIELQKQIRSVYSKGPKWGPCEEKKEDEIDNCTIS